ncbi:uncharacterized protein FOMMEDRAFT_165320 [Fomitiporia mediterranea MF3/22]|uniref:uncharacterized protein n=1 Tax=Fomitiporia mediterranea (strain MF3/22) TaxID=694068 RepID=UPI0004407C40|nr:uncharacterized protein FOMMEDRAFT_165320 [Fomitiporia mediterranea MF3/22]EJD06553.1 hypothetical protein FOMMEDRAFT_165320 [Fomitiporia mediterranea MF3/22]
MLRSTFASNIRLSSLVSSRQVVLQRNFGNRRNVSHWTTQKSLQINATRSTFVTKSPRHEVAVKLRSSLPRRHGHFVGALLASVLKVSASIQFASMITKIALTFVPFLAVRKIIVRKYLNYVIQEKPELEYKRGKLEEKLRKNTRLYRALIAVPIVIFGLTFVASLERTPLSGRWRVILLSPEEEDAILKQLQGDGWYRAVLEVISQDGSPDIIPPSDWRYQVVESVLRRLEKTIPILAVEKRLELPWPDRDPDDVPFPPPANYPLTPRPSAKEYLRWFCDNWCCESRKMRSKHQPAPPLVSSTVETDINAPHLIPGPPYNLVLVDRPDCDNAFSFGFGPDGGGGIVVYSGFLDRVFGKNPTNSVINAPHEEHGPPPSRSMVSELIGSLLAFSSTSGSQATSPSSRAHHHHHQNSLPPPITPTEEQITQLAILLAHELSHLILSHHLETLSAGTVFIPGAISMFSDLLRAVLFPITMIFGPFVNDAVGNLGKIGAGEFAKITEYCSSMNLEFEADAVSARILAHAGFDARHMVSFWEQRRDANLSECSSSRSAEHAKDYDYEGSLVVSALEDGANKSLGVRLARRIVGATHPAHEARLLRLKSELQRWEIERAKAIRRREKRKKKGGMWKKDGEEKDG